MNESTTISTSVSLTSAPAPVPEPTRLVTDLNPVAVYAALANPFRYAVVLKLADGRRCTATQFARTFRRGVDGVSKQMRVLRKAGVVVGQYGKDRRETVYSISKMFRAEVGVLDFGVCRIPLAN